MLKVGDKIHIEYMSDEPQYTGEVKMVSKDPCGETIYHVAWGELVLHWVYLL